jgi:hypothetical protein
MAAIDRSPFSTAPRRRRMTRSREWSEATQLADFSFVICRWDDTPSSYGRSTSRSFAIRSRFSLAARSTLISRSRGRLTRSIRCAPSAPSFRRPRGCFESSNHAGGAPRPEDSSPPARRELLRHRLSRRQRELPSGRPRRTSGLRSDARERLLGSRVLQQPIAGAASVLSHGQRLWCDAALEPAALLSARRAQRATSACTASTHINASAAIVSPVFAWPE